MKRIKIIVKLNDNKNISISNDLGEEIKVDSNNTILKATDIFKLFDNGTNALYKCESKKITKDEEKLTKNELMFNDCVELISDIVTAINEKVKTHNKKSEDTSEEESDTEA